MMWFMQLPPFMLSKFAYLMLASFQRGDRHTLIYSHSASKRRLRNVQEACLAEAYPPPSKSSGNDCLESEVSIGYLNFSDLQTIVRIDYYSLVYYAMASRTP